MRHPPSLFLHALPLVLSFFWFTLGGPPLESAPGPRSLVAVGDIILVEGRLLNLCASTASELKVSLT